MKSYSVLTLSKYPDHLDRCLSSLFITHQTLTLDDVYVVDDGLPEDVKRRWKVHYIPGKNPFYFARNFNIGLQTTPKQKDVFYIGNDGTMETPDGIERLAMATHRLPHVGAVSPAITGPVKNFHQSQGTLFQLETRSALEKTKQFCPTIVFIAVYLTRSAIEAVGPIPEELTGYGYEDDYFCEKMKAHHLEWAVEPAVVVQHNTGASSYKRMGCDVVKLQEQNSKTYQQLMKKNHA